MGIVLTSHSMSLDGFIAQPNGKAGPLHEWLRLVTEAAARNPRTMRRHPDQGGDVIANRSVPPATVIPELAYADVTQASDWLCSAFGFTVRLRIGNHRAQLMYGDGAVIVTRRADTEGELRTDVTHSMLMRVEDADSHHEQAARHGARILSPPSDYPYGERQYTAEDLGSHHWTFSQSIADVDPASWGGVLVAAEAE